MKEFIGVNGLMYRIDNNHTSTLFKNGYVFLKQGMLLSEVLTALPNPIPPAIHI